MEDLFENKNDFIIINEKDNERIIKEISSTNLNDYPKKKLISLISTESKFFDYIDINALKLFDSDVISSLSQEKIRKLTIGQLEKLASAEQIKNLNDQILNLIKLNGLSDNFFKQISFNQFKLANFKVIKNIVKLRKIDKLNELNKKMFYNFSFNKIEDIKDIIYCLLKSGKDFEYITNDNFIHLAKFIGKNEKLDKILKKLSEFHYKEDENDINTSYYEGVLNFKDIIHNDVIIIKHDEIKSKIQNYLDEDDNYDLLRDYCLKCFEKDDDRIASINALNEVLNYPTYNIFQKIEQYKIYEILVLIDNKENRFKHYNRLFKIIKEINNLQLNDPCEFDEKIIFFSRLIKERNFDIDFLEMLAEENMRNIKYLINTFFSGTDKTAIPENLRNLQVKIINDYLEIIKNKYNIQDNLLINKLENIVKDKENLEIKLNMFINSLNTYEKLYYDLLMQSIAEMPSFEKNVESKANTFFKFLRDIALTYAGAKCASLTGSKVLTSISVGIGVAKILKNIKDEVIKSYFSWKDNQKKIYLKNYKNTPKTTGAIILKKIKDGCRKVAIPIKKLVNNIIRYKILKIKNEAKVGLDKLNEKLKNGINLNKEFEFYRKNYILSYIDNKKSLNEPIYIQNLYNIRDKLRTQCYKKQSKKMNEFSKVKKELINYFIDKRKNELKKKYPEFDETLFNKSKSFFYNIKDFVVGAWNGLMSAITFNYLDLRIKDNDYQIIEKLINGVKATNYKNELEKYQKDIIKFKNSLAKDEINFYVKSSEDKNIYGYLEIEEKARTNNLENLKNKLLDNEIDNNIDNRRNNVNKIEDQDIISNDISFSCSDNFDDKNELLIK